MTFFNILILAVVQGVYELLPVSSSAHVVLAEKLMGLDPTAPDMTLLLVMLHTGTMLAVIVYFWRAWRERYFASSRLFCQFAARVTVATGLTGAIGLALMLLIERVILRGSAHAEIEYLFGNAYVIAAGLAAVGVMIILPARQSPSNVSRRLARTEMALALAGTRPLAFLRLLLLAGGRRRTGPRAVPALSGRLVKWRNATLQSDA